MQDKLASTGDPALVADVDLRLGLVGRGIQLSRTPGMHMAEASAHGLRCTYELLDMDIAPPEPLEAVIDRAEADGYAGLNVTYPYKQQVLPLLDTLSDAARRIGAVNTVVFRGGKRFGHNTDYWGFSESLRQGLGAAPLGRVLLVGAGGAGAALAHALADLGATDLQIADARPEAAAALAAQVGGVARPVTDIAAALATSDGIVNATPVGMAKLPGSPVDTALLTERQWVSDIVYFPLETAFLMGARARGCRTMSGEGMAVFQAVRAFELFSGKAADPARMRAVFHQLGAERSTG